MAGLDGHNQDKNTLGGHPPPAPTTESKKGAGLGIQKKKKKKNLKQATRKRLGMHVLLIEVEERKSEGKTPSILVKERESRGRNSRPSKRWIKNCPSSSERAGICMESRGCNKSE
jgi:hypothetical protein